MQPSYSHQLQCVRTWNIAIVFTFLFFSLSFFWIYCFVLPFSHSRSVYARNVKRNKYNQFIYTIKANKPILNIVSFLLSSCAIWRLHCLCAFHNKEWIIMRKIKQNKNENINERTSTRAHNKTWEQWNHFNSKRTSAIDKSLIIITGTFSFAENFFVNFLCKANGLAYTLNQLYPYNSCSNSRLLFYTKVQRTIRCAISRPLVDFCFRVINRASFSSILLFSFIFLYFLFICYCYWLPNNWRLSTIIGTREYVHFTYKWSLLTFA